MRYEEFVERMRNCYTEEDRKKLWDDMSEPMGVEEIRSMTGLPIVTCEVIQPLTRRQGFVVDWATIEDDVVGWVPVALKRDPNSVLYQAHDISHYIPRPAPKMREMTKHELETMLIHELIVAEYVAVTLDYNTMIAICKAAGISTQVSS